MGAEGSLVPGFYGKVPSCGDFIRRRLPRDFLQLWDEWMQRSFAISKEQLQSSWLDDYLTSPIWRFALTAGLCGEMVATGVIMPSVDSVGRYYPMTISVLLPSSRSPLEIAAAGGAWFCTVEETALFCLDDGFTLEAFRNRVDDLGAPPGGASAAENGGPQASGLKIKSESALGWRLTDSALDQLGAAVYPSLLDGLVRARYPFYSLWWTTGSDNVKPSLFIYDGLPPEQDFASFLRGWDGD